MRYLERLDDRMATARTVLCVGVDPDPDALPVGFSRDLAGVEAFSRLLVECASPFAAAIKANLAFFEAWGSAGIAALERIRGCVPSGVPFIADAKRGDIGTTSARHATAIFDVLGADAVTASPYLGEEALAPLLDRPDAFVYVLCRTSNPGAGEFQDLLVTDPSAGEAPTPLYLAVARRVEAWDASRGTIGLVVGATAPRELEAVRSAAPGLPFLVPGVGAQGGDLEAVLAFGPAMRGPTAAISGGALLVNVSRGIASAGADSDDVGEAIAEAAQAWAVRLRV